MTSVLVQHLFALSWLLAAVSAGGLALWHFWRTGRVASTATTVAVALAGTFFFFWPRIQGVLTPPALFTALMFTALVLALTSFVAPLVTKLRK